MADDGTDVVHATVGVRTEGGADDDAVLHSVGAVAAAHADEGAEVDLVATTGRGGFGGGADEEDVTHGGSFNRAEEADIAVGFADAEAADGVALSVVGALEGFGAAGHGDVGSLAEGLAAADVAGGVDGCGEVAQVGLGGDGVGGGASLVGGGEEVVAEGYAQLRGVGRAAVIDGIGGRGHYDDGCRAERGEGIAADGEVGAADVDALDAGGEVSGPGRRGDGSRAAEGQRLVGAVAVGVAHRPCGIVAARAGDGDDRGGDGDVGGAYGDGHALAVGGDGAAGSCDGGRAADGLIGIGDGEGDG